MMHCLMHCPAQALGSAWCTVPRKFKKISMDATQGRQGAQIKRSLCTHEHTAIGMWQECCYLLIKMFDHNTICCKWQRAAPPWFDTCINVHCMEEQGRGVEVAFTHCTEAISRARFVSNEQWELTPMRPLACKPTAVQFIALGTNCTIQQCTALGTSKGSCMHITLTSRPASTSTGNSTSECQGSTAFIKRKRTALQQIMQVVIITASCQGMLPAVPSRRKCRHACAVTGLL